MGKGRLIMPQIQMFGTDPSKAQWGQLGQSLGQGLGIYQQRQQQQQQMAQQQQQQSQLANALFGPQGAQQYGNLPAEQQLAVAKMMSAQQQQMQQQQEQQRKEQTKYQEKIAPFEGALETLDEMEKIGKRGKLGVGSYLKGIISPETRRDRAMYERLGKSLISYASNIPIRNRQEFETLAHDLYDPGISDDSRAGILEAMKRIIQNSMKSISSPEGAERAKPAGKSKPPLQSFMR